MDDMLGKLVKFVVTVPAEWLGTLCDLLEKLLSANGAEWYENLKKFLRKEATWVQQLAEVCDAKVAQAVRKTLTVLPNLTLAERIIAGNYGKGNVNSDIIEKRFPHDVTTIGEWEFKLVHPNRQISSADAKTESETDGWTVAKAEHILAYGEAFPKEQQKYPIIELGSVCEVEGGRGVLVLWGGDGGRDLDLHWWRAVWLAGCRFLVVRKVQSSKT